MARVCRPHLIQAMMPALLARCSDVRWRVLALALCTAACSAEPQATDAPVLKFSAARVRIVSGADTSYLHTEIASSAEQRTLGLMERAHLPDSAGMLFLHMGEQPATAGFWMFRTRIPLDIAFLDSLGVIRAIKNMVPCTETMAAGCPTYPPGVPYHAALEVNAGYFAQRRIGVGARVVLGDTLRVR